MTSTIRPDEWRPIGVEDLEPHAWQALKREGSTLVVAGPGSGKTEFLAQRAAYLLQTGLCPAPRRILAISFKRDAALNLKRRVDSRCTVSEARRFVSVTFDAFTKSIVDRFHDALPEVWRPTKPYEIEMINPKEVTAFLQEAMRAAPQVWRPQIAALSGTTFESQIVGRMRLDVTRPEPQNGHEYAINRWWQDRLAGEPSSLTFACLNRLAELVIRTNSEVRTALLATYPFVFVDEFQDTTYAQYDFLNSAFFGTDTVVTAVGDDKQRIMTWAGAQPDVFGSLREDFRAEEIPLLVNFRSSSGLVHLQTVVGRAISADAPMPESKAPSDIDGHVAEIWRFSEEDSEARHVAAWLKNDMATRGKTPRDYALLVRQLANDFEEQLRPAFHDNGHSIRNESRPLGRTTLQDLLSEDVTPLILSLLRLGTRNRDATSWATVSQALPSLRGLDPTDETAQRNVQDQLETYIAALRRSLAGSPEPDVAGKLMDSVIDFLGVHDLRAVYLRYAAGDSLDIVLEAFTKHLANCANESDDWVQCLDLFEGSSSVPLMTIHKSKGLEYDTIIFLGLDDKSWWSFKQNVIEGRATFLVALSRAKQRVVFTYREDRARWEISELYELLRQAGVPEKSLG